MELRDYQRRAIDSMEQSAKDGVTRQLVVMATGLGKTVVVAALIARRLGQKGDRTYGVMHREELLQQAAAQIREQSPLAKVGIEKAGSTADLESNVILAGVQTVGRKDRKRLSRVSSNWPALVWVDEAHHSPAGSYLEVLEHFGLYGDSPRRDALLVGTTATPDRLDEMGYDKIFDDVVFRYDLRDAIRDGWLADIHAWRVATDLDLDGVRSRAGDFAQGELSEAIKRSNVNEAFLRTWEEKSNGKKNLVYCVDKEHAAVVHGLLLKKGLNAAVIVDDTPADERKKIVAGFRRGDISVVVNVAVLTEGFDAPDTQAIHILRPTKSRSLYTQIIGRGTRRTPQKDFVEIFDYTHQEHDVCSIGRIFGLPDTWTLEGQSVPADADKVEEMEAELGISADGAKNVEDIVKSVKTRRFDLLKSTLEDNGLPSRLSWVRPSPKAERWTIAWRNETKEKPDRVPEELRADYDRWGMWGTYERIEIFRNELGGYEARLLRASSEMLLPYIVKLDSDKSLVRLTGRVEDLVSQRRPHKMPLLRKNAAWARKPCSENQQAVLRKKGVPEEVVTKLNQREASILIATPAKTIKEWFPDDRRRTG